MASRLSLAALEGDERELFSLAPPETDTMSNSTPAPQFVAVKRVVDFEDINSAIDALAASVGKELDQIAEALRLAAPTPDGGRTSDPDPVAVTNVLSRIANLKKQLDADDSVITILPPGSPEPAPAVGVSQSSNPNAPDYVAPAAQSSNFGAPGFIPFSQSTDPSAPDFVPSARLVSNPDFDASQPESASNKRFI